MRGNEQDLIGLIRVWEHSLLRIAFRIVGNIEDAEEVRQVVLLKLIEKQERISEVSNLDGWIRTCVVHEAISWLRRKKSRRVMMSKFESAATRNTASTGDEFAMRADDRDLLNFGLRALKPEQRAILSLRFDEDLTVREIGEVLGQPHTTVQSRLQVAITELRARVRSAVGEERR
jgi:RNA polymerase sigma-70 factor (ECF subfamily)